MARPADRLACEATGGWARLHAPLHPTHARGGSSGTCEGTTSPSRSLCFRAPMEKAPGMPICGRPGQGRRRVCVWGGGAKGGGGGFGSKRGAGRRLVKRRGPGTGAGAGARWHARAVVRDADSALAWHALRQLRACARPPACCLPAGVYVPTRLWAASQRMRACMRSGAGPFTAFVAGGGVCRILIAPRAPPHALCLDARPTGRHSQALPSSPPPKPPKPPHLSRPTRTSWKSALTVSESRSWERLTAGTCAGGSGSATGGREAGAGGGGKVACGVSPQRQYPSVSTPPQACMRMLRTEA